MVEYAAMDGQYLIPLARILERELKEKGRLSWVEEECLFMTKVRFAAPNYAPLYLKVKGAKHLDPKSLAVLESLLEFREAQAQKSDLPPFKVIGNEPLLEMAIKKPLSREEMETGKTLSRKQMDRYGAHLLRGIQRAMAILDKDLPVYPRGNRPDIPWAVRHRVKALKNWRDQQAKALEIDPGILMNNVLINTLALKNTRSLNEMEEIPGLKKWVKDHFGREILAIQTGEQRKISRESDDQKFDSI
jgi:ribonuclease D